MKYAVIFCVQINRTKPSVEILLDFLTGFLFVRWNTIKAYQCLCNIRNVLVFFFWRKRKDSIIVTTNIEILDYFPSENNPAPPPPERIAQESHFLQTPSTAPGHDLAEGFSPFSIMTIRKTSLDALLQYSLRILWAQNRPDGPAPTIQIVFILSP